MTIPAVPETGPTTQAPAGAERSRGTALVTGATGYIGGLLVDPLLAAGWSVRVLTRSSQRLAGRPWLERVDVVEGDATEPADLDRALTGVDVAYYLLHSMDGKGDFAERDRRLARSFSDAAGSAGVRRIVYLGGIHPAGERLSAHLASRVEVGQILLDGPVPATCLQAGVVLGDGSASFDMLRHLTERLPAFVAPTWLRNRIQPIAVRDALRYLVGAAGMPPEVNRTFDIAGPDVLTYAEMMQRFAVVTGRRRRLIATVPVLTPGLASHWVGLVTPVAAGIARPLVGSLVHEVVAAEHDIAAYVPDPAGGLTGFDDAVRAAMAHTTDSSGRRNVVLASAAVLACAVAGGVATDPSSEWYRRLDLPSWQPPPSTFGLVWTPLYAALAGASASAITAFEDDEKADQARRYWAALGINLALNAGWSAVFFRARRLDLATVTAALLTASSADLARRAGSAGRGHAVVLAPYAGWCGFATVLTGAIARLNHRTVSNRARARLDRARPSRARRLR